MAADTEEYMKNTSINGRLGEIKVATYLMSKGFDIFIPFGSSTEVDLVGIKNRRVFKIQVKSTKTRERTNKNSWVVQLKSVRSNTSNVIINNYDNSKYDLLAVYIIPEDRIRIFLSKNINNKSSIQIKGL